MTHPYTPTAMLHGFDAASLDHMDHDTPDCESWNVWLRRDYPNGSPHGEPFDSDDSRDRDFDSLDDAREYVHQLADEFKCDIDEY